MKDFERMKKIGVIYSIAAFVIGGALLIFGVWVIVMFMRFYGVI